MERKPPSLQIYMDPANSDIHLFFFFPLIWMQPIFKVFI